LIPVVQKRKRAFSIRQTDKLLGLFNFFDEVAETDVV
jgi:hypothetical protein